MMERPMERTIHVGVSLSAAEDLREAALPLFEAGEIDALEWSLDLGFSGVADWVLALLEHYGAEGRLVAHGVELSTFTVGQEDRRAWWMGQAKAALSRWRFQHLSEHVGIMSAGAMLGGTPLAHPYTKSIVAVGHRASTSSARSPACRSASRTSRSRSGRATSTSSRTSSRRCSLPRTGSSSSISTTSSARPRATSAIRSS
jgi:hypothetical protein